MPIIHLTDIVPIKTASLSQNSNPITSPVPGVLCPPVRLREPDPVIPSLFLIVVDQQHPSHYKEIVMLPDAATVLLQHRQVGEWSHGKTVMTERHFGQELSHVE